MANARTWKAFKIIRICVYVISILLTIALAAIYAILLIRGWTSFLAGQRAIMLVLLFVHGLSTIILYLMVLIPFRVWLDGARIAVLLIFQVGGTVTFSLFYPGFPCNNLGDVPTCKRVEMTAIFGGWALAGFLLIYAFGLSAMCYVPEPSARRLMLIEDGPLTSQQEKEVYSEKAQKRLSQSSTGSERSVYSQSSFYAADSSAFPRPPYRPGPGPPTSPQSVIQLQFPPPYYRPDTPGSIRSNAPSSVSEIRESTRQRYYQSGLMPAPAPRFPPGLIAPPPPESLSRQTTTSSIRSAMSSRNGQRTQQQQQKSVQFVMPSANEYYEYPPANSNSFYQFDSNRMVRSSNPAWNGLPSVPQSQPRPLLLSTGYYPGYTASPTPMYQRSTSPPPSARGYSPRAPMQPLPQLGRVSSPAMSATSNGNMATPPLMLVPTYAQQPRMAPPLPTLQIPAEGRRTPSRTPSRTGSLSSVPRSPSPQESSSPYGLPDRQQFTLLPAHPQLPLRAGSAMGLRRNDSGNGVTPYNLTTIAPAFEHRRTASDSRGVVDRSWTQLNDERNAAINRWRQLGKYAPPA